MKISLCLFLFLVMTSTVSAQQLAIQKGNLAANYMSEDWNLHQGNGPRVFKTFVVFDTQFQSAPTVVVSLTGVDAPNEHGLRVSLKIDRVTVTGFLLKILTWENSTINGVEVTWLAISKNE
jgi:hypothetical protein